MGCSSALYVAEVVLLQLEKPDLVHDALHDVIGGVVFRIAKEQPPLFIDWVALDIRFVLDLLCQVVHHLQIAAFLEPQSRAFQRVMTQALQPRWQPLCLFELRRRDCELLLVDSDFFDDVWRDSHTQVLTI